MWLRRWRLFITIYALGAAVAVREYVVTRSSPPVQWPSPEWSRMVEVVSRINPDHPDTYWLEGEEARVEGDTLEFVLNLEEALASDIKHNEYLLQDYAQLMLGRGADYRIVNWAVNRWRENHPFSASTLALQLGTPPRTQSDEAALDRALSRVPWIGGWRVEPHEATDGSQRWRLQLAFRPGQEVDIRQAVEAVTTLSLTEEQRASHEVTCMTLVDCRLVPRG